jgi:hypothetical protein
MAQSFRDLVVWQKAMALATEVYRVTERFPRTETYGLTNQLRRAVVGVPSDIAEGKGRLSKRLSRRSRLERIWITSAHPSSGGSPSSAPRSEGF